MAKAEISNISDECGISKDESIERYNAEKSRRIKAGRIESVLCSAALSFDTVLSAVFYLLCAIHPLVFTFLSKPNFGAGTAAYTPATVENAEPGELFVIIVVLLIIFVLKLALAISSIVVCAAKKSISPLLATGSIAFCFVNLIFSVITLTYPQSYTEPIFTVFLVVNILLTILSGVCIYLTMIKREIREYCDTL